MLNSKATINLMKIVFADTHAAHTTFALLSLTVPEQFSPRCFNAKVRKLKLGLGLDFEC